MRSRMRRSASFIVLSLLGCGGGTTPAAPPPLASGPEVSFSLPSDTGELVTVPLPGAQHTVLDFFGPSCEPCAKKVPELVGRRPEIERRGGKLVLVAVLADGESTGDAERALKKWGAPARADRFRRPQARRTYVFSFLAIFLSASFSVRLAFA